MLGIFDCFSGVAGDMVLGAMLDAGLPLNYLERQLNRFSLRGYKLVKKTERRGVIGGINLQVAVRGRVGDGGYKDICRMIKKSVLNENTKKISLNIFEILAHAEAHVHRTSIDHAHFHEVGAADSIVDIVGAAIGFDYFKFDGIYASPLPVTRGWVRCEHGRMPVPAPATLEILKGVPLTASPVKAEIVTPTGAAILKAVTREFGGNPIREIKKIGYGHGDNNYKIIPNSLRLIIGEGERLFVIEANIDDMNPQIYEYLIERLIENGALDVTVRDVLMKKRRPGAQVQILGSEGLVERLVHIILRETTSIGVRYYPVSRGILEREIKTVKTKYGNVRIKIAKLGGDVLNISPEYEDCKRLARAKKIPLKEIYNLCLKSII